MFDYQLFVNRAPDTVKEKYQIGYHNGRIWWKNYADNQNDHTISELVKMYGSRDPYTVGYIMAMYR